MSQTHRNIGRQRNTMLRYRLVMQEFEKHNCNEVPITVIWRNHIYPRFAISRQTLYTIFNTNIDETLHKVHEQSKQLHFDFAQ